MANKRSRKKLFKDEDEIVTRVYNYLREVKHDMQCQTTLNSPYWKKYDKPLKMTAEILGIGVSTVTKCNRRVSALESENSNPAEFMDSHGELDTEVSSKKRKLEEEASAEGHGEPKKVSQTSLKVDGNGSEVKLESDVGFDDFNGFEITKVLSNSADYKRVVVQAKVEGGKTAVIVLDKKPFTDDVLGQFFSEKSQLKHTFQNDIYGSYDCNPVAAAAEIKATVVYPATEKHIEKYIFRPLHLIDETAEIYKNVTLPYLESSSFNNQWVFNILEHKKETDRIVFEDPDPTTGFILLPDLKWDGVALENLYLVGIVHARGIKSIRDLTKDHLPLLENLLKAGSKAIEDKYSLKRSQLRIYLHYQPSYYHLHIHFTALGFNAPGIFTEKSHLLQSVIANIKGNPNYYQEAVLPFVVKQGEKLYQNLIQYGYEL